MRLENSLRVSVTNRRKRIIVKLYAFLRIMYPSNLLDGNTDLYRWLHSVHVNARVVDHR